jgi:hypothetical protein
LSGYLEQGFTAMLKQQETMQSELAKAWQAPLAPLNELAKKNMELWEQMQAAGRDLFTGRGAGKTKPSDADDQQRTNDESKGK